MASLLNSLKQGLSVITRVVQGSITTNITQRVNPCSCRTVTTIHNKQKLHERLKPMDSVVGAYCLQTRSYSKQPPDSHMYDAYQEFETPSPFKRRQPLRYGYHPKYHKGDVLPRPKGKYEDLPVRGSQRVFPKDRDAWTEQKALFGQNDYIDILGDGNVHPWRLIKAPVWLKGFKGPELERLLRRMKYQGRQLQYTNPTKYHLIQKRIFYLYKKRNNFRKSATYRGGRGAANRGRLEGPKGRLNEYQHPMKIPGW